MHSETPDLLEIWIGGGYICVFEQNKLIINNHMETKHKDLYDAPSTRVFEVKTEGVICTSGIPDPLDPFTPGGDPLNP